jgi:hypothetical protein
VGFSNKIFSTMSNVTIKFIKSPTGRFNLAYNAEDVVDFPQNQAVELIESGYAVAHTPNQPGHDPVDLPGDIPGRAKLISAGILTMAELKKYTQFSDINGIGKSLAAQLAAYMS